MAVNISFAQSYYHSPDDSIVAEAVANDFNVYNITQIHPTNDTLYFKWNKQSVSMPITWEAGICDNGECNSFLKDSGAMIPIVPGDNGLMSLHINPHNESGTAIIRYTIFEIHQPQKMDTLTWIISAGGHPNNISKINAKQDPKIWVDNGNIHCVNLNNNFSIISVCDLQGRKLFIQKIRGNEARISFRDINSGIYVLQLKGRNNFSRKIFIP